MTNDNFSLEDVLAALDTLGLDYALHGRRDVGPLRFCSAFAQEPTGLYFWEGDAGAAAFDYADITVLTACRLDADIACQIELRHPQRAFYLLMRHFFAPPPATETSIHPTAVVAPGAHIGAGTVIGPYCVIGDCQIGANCHFDSHVVVKDHCAIGDRVTIESHSTIGATGVAWVWDPHTGERIVQPQIGGTRIGDDCFIGTDVTVVRGSVNEVTSLGDGCVVAHGTKIGHGCVIGAHVHFANNVSIAGNCSLGDRTFLSSASVLRPRIVLARGVVVGAGAVVTRNVDQEDVVVSGVPARLMDTKASHVGVPKLPS
ncbi:MAG: DapH/DapD/GlmU-related protein [Burkholderiaceae bacterium]